MQISRGSCKLVYILLSKIVTSNIQNYFCITYTDKNIFDNSYENRSKQFCSTRAGNLGNVLLTSRNCQTYFYQCTFTTLGWSESCTLHINPPNYLSTSFPIRNENK